MAGSVLEARDRRWPVGALPTWTSVPLLGVAFLILYWRTLAPDVVGHDAGEFQFVPAIFGIPHSTGYPLFLVIGKLWSLLPIGSVAYRMNLLSALFGAFAVVLTAWAGLQATGSITGALTAGLALGLAPLEWTWSTIAGVRSLAVAFVGALVLAALIWQRRATSGSESGARRLQASVERGDSGLETSHTGVRMATGNRALLVLALLVGLALDHHRTIVFLLPFLAIFVLLTDIRLIMRPAWGLKFLVVAVSPLLLYAVLPWRAAHGAPWDQDHPNTLGGFVNLALAPAVSSAHLGLGPAQVLARIPLLAKELLQEFPAPVLILAVVGLVWLTWQRPSLCLVLAGYTIVMAVFTLLWNVGDALNSVYFMPAYVPVALFAGCGVAWVHLRTKRSWVGRGANLPAAALILMTAASGLQANRLKFAPQPEVLDDFRQDLFAGHQARRLADAMASLPAGATVVSDWDQATALWYGQFIDGLAPGVAISYPTSTLTDVLARTRGPVFLASASLKPQGVWLTSWGPFVEVLRQPPTTLPGSLISAGGIFDQEIELLGMAPLHQPQYGVLPVTLYFKALKQPAADYAVSARLMPTPNRVASQNDQASPVLGLSPTSHWIAGQVTADYHELDLRGLPDGRYDLAVVLYQPLPGGKFRDLSYGPEHRAVLGQLTVERDFVAFAPATRYGSSL